MLAFVSVIAHLNNLSPTSCVDSQQLESTQGV